ncbi:hypothetical protein MTP99_019462 [Tenebrio molitor]|nr:hypothetical protein MTP99_019462 [Tenebrio molitor]
MDSGKKSHKSISDLSNISSTVVRSKQLYINVNKGFTYYNDTVCQFTRAYNQNSEASIRLSKPRSPIWFRTTQEPHLVPNNPWTPIRPQTIFLLHFSNP